MPAKKRSPDRVELRVRDDEPSVIAVVADTHSLPHPRAAENIAATKPLSILHAGDIGELSVLEDLAQIAPVHAVRGNIDTHAGNLPDSLTLDVKDDKGILFTILMMHIAVLGPRIRADASRLARSQGAALLVCGHSHVPFIGSERGLTVFNPGSIGPRRFQLPIVFGVLDVSRAGVKLRHVDCETGKVWEPRALLA